MKRRIFVSVFFAVFLGLQIYEAIAAIFWQSASYVNAIVDQFFVRFLLFVHKNGIKIWSP